MSNPYSEKDLLNDLNGLPKISSTESSKPKVPEILSLDHKDKAPDYEDENDDDVIADRKRKRREEEMEKEQLQAMLEEIEEAEKHLSPWATSISPRSLRSMVMSYQADSVKGKCKAITCPDHVDTLMFPLLEQAKNGERVTLRCSVVTCLRRIDLSGNEKLVNAICENNDRHNEHPR